MDLLGTPEGLSVLEIDHSVHRTVLSEAFREVVSLEETIALLLSLEGAIAQEASVEVIHSVVFPVAVTPADFRAAVTSAAQVMPEVTDNPRNQLTVSR